jgi:CubicO group peptidase (beta-lactamase class C family)
VPNTDILWAGGFDITADEVLRRMRYAQPAYSLRGGFVYQNVMYLVAGKVIERVSGMPWQRFMVERVFGPLGMKNTFATLSASSAYKNRSIAHFMSSGSIRGMSEEMAADEIAPAGSVWSTADDMGIWLNFLLGFSDKKLLQPATMSELFKPQVILPGNFYPTFQVLKPKWTTYGLGWFQHDYRGEKVDFHTGSLTGRTAIAGLIRDRGMGVYVFGNLNREQLRHALMYKAFDTFAFNEPNGRDWSSEFKKLYDGIDATNNAQTASREQRRMKDTRPSLPLASYAGRYSDPFVGTVQVEFTGGKLIVTPGKNTSGELEHRHLDAFIVRWKPEWRGEDLVSFQLSPLDGQVTSLTIAGQTLRKVGN